MPKPPPLTPEQKARLARLEPALRLAVNRGDYEKAKLITRDIQSCLRATGHETRLMQAKNRLFEAAMEAGRLNIAKQGFNGVRQKVSKRTRIYLEATALLAISHLRGNDIDAAEPLIAEVLQNDTVIRSEKRRRSFRRRIIARFEEEGTLAAIRGYGREILDIDRIQEEAGLLTASRSDEEILTSLGEAVPEKAVAVLLRIDGFSRGQLPPAEIRLLPGRQAKQDRKEVGRTVFTAIKRVVWRSLCDPESEVYRAWYDHGMMFVLNKKYITAAVITALSGMGIGIQMLAATAAALVFRMGIEVYCESYKPEGVMDIRSGN